MSNEYATLTDIKATLTLTGETFADADLRLGLTAASRAIDNICERRFWLDTDATTVRYYTPTRRDARRILEIDDLVTFAALDTDNDGDGVFENSWTLYTDFVLEPLNGAEDGLPYTLIRALPQGTHMFPGGPRGIMPGGVIPRSVRVTGQFGWSSVPDEIQQATVILAGRLTRRSREAPFGLIGFAMETGTNVASLSRTDPDVMMLLAPFRRHLVA